MTLTRGLHHPPSPALVSPRRASPSPSPSPAPQKRNGGGLSSPLAVKRRNTTNTTNPQRFQLCRLCATGDFAVFSLEKKPEIVVRLKELLNITLDLVCMMQSEVREIKPEAGAGGGGAAGGGPSSHGTRSVLNS